MKVEFKYNLRDIIYFMRSGKVQESTIEGVSYRKFIDSNLSTTTELIYEVDQWGDFREDQLFRTQEELFQAIKIAS